MSPAHRFKAASTSAVLAGGGFRSAVIAYSNSPKTSAVCSPSSGGRLVIAQLPFDS